MLYFIAMLLSNLFVTSTPALTCSRHDTWRWSTRQSVGAVVRVVFWVVTFQQGKSERVGPNLHLVADALKRIVVK